MAYLIMYEPNGLIRNCVHEPGDDYIEMCIEREIPYLLCEGKPPPDIHTVWYFNGEDMVKRPVIANLTDLPSPCVVVVDEVSYTVEDGSLELDGTDPGVYTIKIDQWPYMPFETEIEIR